MESSAPLPELQQSEIDGATLAQLFEDVGTHAQILEIIPKRTPGYIEENPAPLQLDEAYQLLVSSQVRGLQLRYRHQDKTWWDTLMPLPGGLYRIVRIGHDFT